MSAVLKSVAERAIELISRKYGSLKDLPEEFRQVIWVTAYRASAISLKIENDGGAIALTKSMLIGGGLDAREFETSIRELEFLVQMVPIVRSGQPRQKAADAQLVIDILKWGIIDAPNMSVVRRMITRKFASADKMYDMPMPEEISL